MKRKTLKSIYELFIIAIVLSFGLSKVYACNSTEYWDNDSEQCESCPDGSWCDGSSEHTCTSGFYCKNGVKHSCPSGYNYSSSRSVNASDCYLKTMARYWVQSKNGAEVACTAGGYCPGNITVHYGSTGGRISCPTADSGWTATSPESSDEATDCYEYKTPSNCSSGRIERVAINENGYSSTNRSFMSNSNALRAKAGYYDEWDVGCFPCPIGEYQPLDNAAPMTTCSKCEIGTYQDETGKASCKKCSTVKPGYTTSKVGATSPNDCNVPITCNRDEYLDSTSGNCENCPEGYTSNPGSTDKNNDCKITCDPGNYHKATEGCILCPVGTFSSGTITTGYGTTVNCTACPDGYTTRGSGYTSRNDCRITCSEGQYHDALNGCKPCPKGTFSSSNIDVGYGTTVNCTACPDGYTTSSTGAKSPNDCIVPSNKKTITADANGGTITTTTGWTNASDNKTATKSVTSGSTIGTLPTVTRSGYTLKEWRTKSDGTGDVVTSSTTATASMTIYAIWTANSSSTLATITANANGGTITATSGWTNATDNKTATRRVETGSAIGTLPNVTRSGYTLKEWRTKADGTGDVVTSSTTATADATIYAIWTESTTTTSYTITANANGGKMEIYGDQTGGADSTTNTAGFILYPNAMPGVEYTITMSSAALTSGSATKFSTRCYDLTSDATLSRKDVSFGSNISYTITCPSTANAEHQLVIPIYYGEAGATAGNHVTFSNIKIAVNTGWTNVSGNLTATKSISSGSTYGTLPIAVRPGYTLKEWNTKSDGTGTKVTSSITATANATIYAIWTKTSPDAPTPPSSTTSYQISFDCNGGTGSMSPMSVSFGQTVTLIANACARTGYTFTGWAGYIGGTPIDGGTYSDGDSFDYTFESDMILKAQWNSNSGTSGTYLIHYDANGGTGTMADTEATVDVTGSLRANAFKYSGHTFDGWRAYYVDSDGNLVPLKDSSNNEVELKNKASFKNLYGPNGEEVTLYAQWKVVNPSTGIFVPTVIIGGLLLISAFGYYLVKKKNVVLE